MERELETGNETEVESVNCELWYQEFYMAIEVAIWIGNEILTWGYGY